MMAKSGTVSSRFNPGTRVQKQWMMWSRKGQIQWMMGSRKGRTYGIMRVTVCAPPVEGVELGVGWQQPQDAYGFVGRAYGRTIQSKFVANERHACRVKKEFE
jgi:hypothetical protein